MAQRGAILVGKNLAGWLSPESGSGWSQRQLVGGHEWCVPGVRTGVVSVWCLYSQSGGGGVLSGSLQVTLSCRCLQAGCDSKEC